MWYIYAMEYYSTIKRNGVELVLVRWMNLEPVILSEVSQKVQNKYHIIVCVRAAIHGVARSRTRLSD